MKNKIKLSIVIPCYNEEKNISQLKKEINSILNKNNSIEVILVDNGSSDKSNIILKKYVSPNRRLKLVTIKKNIGYGHGIVSGIKKSRGTIIAWVHSDLQISMKDLIKAYIKNYKKLIEGKYIVKGTRKNRNYIDNLFTFLMSCVVNTFFNVSLRDINAQPKIFSSKFKNQVLGNPPQDFSLDLFLLLKAIKHNYKIINFPVTLKKRRFEQAKGGGTFWGKIKLTVRTFSYIFNLRFIKNY